MNKSARREASAQQQSAYKQQQAAYQTAQTQATAYQNDFTKRNAAITGIRDYGQQFLDRYHKGTDISELIPASVKYTQQAADTVKNTIQAAGRMGDSSQLHSDSNYQNKLNSVMGAKLGRGMAAINDERLNNEVGQQTENVFNASNFLNADAQAGLNLNSQMFNMSNAIWQNATTRRNMEIQVGQQAFGNLMQGIQVATGIASGFFGAGGMMSGLGRSGGSSASSGSSWTSTPVNIDTSFHNPFSGH